MNTSFIKKTTTAILLFSMLFVIMAMKIPASAAFDEAKGRDRVISIEEYVSALQEAYAEYGVKVELLDYDPTVTITYGMLCDELATVEYKATTIEIRELSSDVVYKQDQHEENSLHAMPITATASTTWNITKPGGSAYMKTTVTAKVDPINNAVVSVTSYSTKQSGAFVNFLSWTTSSHTGRRNSPSTGRIAVTIEGDCRFAQAIPGSGTIIGYTYEISQTRNVSFW